MYSDWESTREIIEIKKKKKQTLIKLYIITISTSSNSGKLTMKVRMNFHLWRMLSSDQKAAVMPTEFPAGQEYTCDNSSE